MRRGAAANARSRGDLRLALFGGCCTIVGGACLLLAACASNTARVGAPLPAPPAAPQSVPAAPVERPAAKPLPAAAAAATVESPWPRLRASFALPACDYNAAVRRWTHTYTQNPRELSDSLADAMPTLLFVTQALERHRMPGEFAFLPYLESNYVPVATSGDRAAGIWQLMPDTALEAGLRITSDYDGRLDIDAATTAAISLLQQYHEEFGDWRLADMAFNAGLYKIRQLVASRARHGAWSTRDLNRLAVNPGTHDHLAKLLALSCIISDPARFHVELPEPERDDALARLDLPAPVDLQLAARLTGLDPARLRQLNPGYIRGRMPAAGPFRLLVPVSHRLALEQTLGKLPQYAWRNWREVILKRPETLDLFAMLLDLDPQALAAVNGRAADAPLAPGTHLLLPGVAADTDPDVAENAPVAADAAAMPDALVVHAGDTLWDIAHRYGLHVDDLLRWNGLPKAATLRLGQHLLLNAPELRSPGAR